MSLINLNVCISSACHVLVRCSIITYNVVYYSLKRNYRITFVCDNHYIAFSLGKIHALLLLVSLLQLKLVKQFGICTILTAIFNTFLLHCTKTV